MTIDVAEENLRVRVYRITSGYRLTVDYPSTEEYQSRVKAALAHLFRPITATDGDIVRVNGEIND